MARKIDTDAEINRIRMKMQFSHPANPDSGYDSLYIISGSAHGGLYLKDPSGKEIGPFITGSASAFTDFSICQGRLTLTSNTPITSADVTAAGTVYFTPLNGNRIGLYNGSSWDMLSFSETSLSLAGLPSGTNHDIFAYNNAGTLALEALAWTNDTTRATAIALQDGVYVKSGATGRRYLGTLRTTSTPAQTEDSISKRYLWNYYNRASRPMRVVDTTDTWTYNTATWRQAGGVAANKVEYVCGVSDELVLAHVMAYAQIASGTAAGAVGVGVDSTSANSAQLRNEVLPSSTGPVRLPALAEYSGYPGLGYHYIAWLEYVRTGTVTFSGDDGGATVQSGMMAMVNG